MRQERKKGFTLVELLSVIVILGIISSIVIVGFMRTTTDAQDKLDKVTRKQILDAAKAYAVEYRNTGKWVEEKTDDGASFCISLDSLLSSGYFDDKKLNFDEYKDEYVVRGDVNLGNFEFELIELATVSSNDTCEYLEKKHMLTEKNEVTGEYDEVSEISKSSKIENDEKDLGAFNYDVTTVNNRYVVNTNLELTIKEFIKDNTNVFVNILLDESHSMAKDYENAIKAIISFSNTLSESGIKHSLIGFGGYPKLRRDFSIEPLVRSNFSNGWAWATNTHAALDLATSLIYNAKKSNEMTETSKIYTVVFTDGAPLERLWVEDKNSDVYGTIRMASNGGYNLEKNKKAQIYFSKFSELVSDCESPYGDDWKKARDDTSNFICKRENEQYYITFSNQVNSSTAWNYVRDSSGFLKSVGSKVMFVAYVADFSNKKNLTDVVSKDDFCLDSSKKGYCYYFSKNMSQVTSLFNQFSNMFEELTLIDKVKFKLEPIKDSSGVPLIKLYNELGQEIGDNEFEIIDLSEETPQKLNILNKFEFVVNEKSDLFNAKNGLWECTEDNYSCTYEGATKLFDIKLGLHYKKDDSWSDVTIVQPEFDLSLTKISTIN